MRSALEAVAEKVWPKVDCSDRVRYAVYPGRMYILNTEERRREEVVVEPAPGADRVTIALGPGEMREIPL